MKYACILKLQIYLSLVYVSKNFFFRFQEKALCSAKKTFQEIQNMALNPEYSIRMCTPKLSPVYFVLSVLNFATTPLIFSTFWVLVHDTNLNWKNKVCRILSDYCFHCQACLPASIFYVYFAIPFSAIFYGIHGVYECITGNEKVKKLDIFRNYVMDGSEIPFLSLSQQFCEALPQLVIASFLYIVNYPYSIPIAFVTIIFSGVSFIIGLITYLSSGQTMFRKLSDSEFIRIKVYTYDADFFKGRAPERIVHQ